MERKASIDPIADYFQDWEDTRLYLVSTLERELRDADYLLSTFHVAAMADPEFRSICCRRNEPHRPLQTLAVLPVKRMEDDSDDLDLDVPEYSGKLLHSYRIESLRMELEYLLRRERYERNAPLLVRTLLSVRKTVREWWRKHMD